MATPSAEKSEMLDWSRRDSFLQSQSPFHKLTYGGIMFSKFNEFKLFTFAACALMGTPSFAATIEGGRIDISRGMLVLEVSYSGGCETHSFSIDMQGCREISPVDCDARLVENSRGDRCEMGAQETLKFSLRSLGLDKPYYSNGTLTIKGDRNSEVTIQLPPAT